MLENAEAEPKSLLFLPEKSVLIYASDDELIYMWDYKNNSVKKIHCEYNNMSIHLHPNNTDLISVSSLGRISIINLQKRQEVAFFEEKDSILNSTLSHSGSHILFNIITPAHSLRLWNIKTSQLENVFTGFKQTECILKPSIKDNYLAIGKLCITFGSSKIAFVGGEDGKILIWHKLFSQHPVCTIDLSNQNKAKISQNPIKSSSINS